MLAGTRQEKYLKRSKGQMRLKPSEDKLLRMLLTGEHDIKSAGFELGIKPLSTTMKLRRSRERNGIKTIYQQVARFALEQRSDRAATLIGG